MRAAHPRVARTRTAERPGAPRRASEDRVFVTPTAAVVLDGASQPESAERDGGWLADTLGRLLSDGLTNSPSVDLADLLADAIATTARQHSLTPGKSPSTTVGMASWYGERLDVLVLGDSPIVGLSHGGGVLQLRDDRLSRVALKERKAFRQVNAGSFGTQRPQEWRDLVEAQRRQRNMPGGYWIAEASPDAARHAHRTKWDMGNILTLMLMTDGVSDGVDRYGVPATWHKAFDVAARDPSELVDSIHEAEEADPEGVRWPRSKRHDDKALIVVEFNAASCRLRD